jgi:hypothetical protein
MKYQFGNVVVVDGGQIGVIVKSWADDTYEVYVRSLNCVKEYKEDDIRHFVYSKELSDEERNYY